MWCIQLHLISSHPAFDRQTIDVEALRFVLHLILLAWINICSRESTAGHDFPVPCVSISFSCIRFSWTNFREQIVYTAFWSAACIYCSRRRRDKSSISSTSHRCWHSCSVIPDTWNQLLRISRPPPGPTQSGNTLSSTFPTAHSTLQTHYLVACVTRICDGVWVMWSAATPHA